MTIPASQLVDITPRVIGGGLSGLSMVGTLISKNASLPANKMVSFYSQSAVGDYFGTESLEYKLAGNYFIADSNATKKPDVLYFVKKVDAEQAAFVRGMKVTDDVAKFALIDDGSFVITVDGTAITVTDLDLSDQVSYSGIASAIQTKLNATVTGTTCVWNPNFKAFVITSPTSGESSKITFASSTASGTDLSEMLGLASGTISQGADAQDIPTTMKKALDDNSNFFSFMPVFDESADEAKVFAEWCNNQGTRFLYVCVDKTNGGLTPNNSSCQARVLSDYTGVCSVYNTKEVGAMTMGIAASINPDSLNGRKTWAFKQQNGLSATVSDETQAQTLLGNGYNFYGDYATASNQFKLYQNGQMSGDAKWLDTYYGQVFLRDGLQNAWINALMNANTVPYNESGYGVLRAAAMDIINTAVNAGFIRQGVSLSESQKATVLQEAGVDISTALQTQGWYLQILNPTTIVRQERGTPVVNFWYMDGGSVQKIQGTSTVLL